MLMQYFFENRWYVNTLFFQDAKFFKNKKDKA